MARISEWDRDRGGNEHHSRDCTDAEDEEVRYGPARLANRGEHQQGDGGRARKAVDESDHKRAENLIHAQLSESAIEKSERCIFGRARM